MENFLSILKISLAILGGWFAIILWFLLLTVSKSPLNEFIVSIGIIPLMTHTNSGGMITIDHFLLIIQSTIVFSSGGFVTALFSKDQELIACSILGSLAILTCIVWDSCFNCRVYYAIDLFIWFSGFLSIMLSAFIVVRMRLIKYILYRLTKSSPMSAKIHGDSRLTDGQTQNTKPGRQATSKKAWQVK